MMILGFELRASCLLGRCSTTYSTPLILFNVEYFQDERSQTICPGWPPTTILLISAAYIARITCVSQWYSAKNFFLTGKIHQNLTVSDPPHPLRVFWFLVFGFWQSWVSC
jgi:hypothetical protein